MVKSTGIEKGSLKKIMTMCVIASMLISGMIILAQGTSGNERDTVNKEFYYVSFTNAAESSALLRASDVEVVKIDAMGAYIKVHETAKNELANAFQISEVPGRTVVDLMEVGINFDSRSGYEVPAEWRNGNSNQYMVQFVAPMTEEWLESVKMNSLSFFNTIGDNLALVKLSPGQKANVESLPFVEWVGTYEPMFKVYSNARERTGEFNVRISPFGVSVWQLAQELGGMGYNIIDIDDGCNLVDITISDESLPRIAKLESVGLIQYFPEQVQQSSMSGEIVGAHLVWDQTRSNLPQAITGEGQVYQHQDLDMTPAHPDFASGPLGTRVLYCQSAGDNSGHATNCVGIAAGNGYLMETFLGLSTSNRNYNEIAATNPYGFLDRTGFAGRAPETGIVSYDGLVTSELDDGYNTYNARVFSLSYGPVSVTNGYANGVDTFMVAYPNGLAFISACNYGPNGMTVSGNGNGKNAVSVGAAENNRGDWFQSDDNPWGLWTGSCKGPVSATDLRVKPDIVEIGAGVIMTKSPNADPGDNDLYRGSNNLAALRVDANSDGDADYYKNQGTSFSCPAAAGDTILIRDYLVDVKGYDNVGPNEPDAMLLKAYLINGARDMGYGYPSYGQGWGMASPEYSIAPPAPLSVKDWSGTGSSGAISLDVKSPSAPLKISLAHWDTGTVSGALTVDYDLVLTAPDGSTKYYGNAFAESESIPLATANNWAACRFPTWSAFPTSYPTGYYDWDTDNDGGDDINNVEVIQINNPQKGTWTLNVVLRAGTAAKWSVVAYADFGPQLNYQVGMKQDAPVNYHMRDGYGTQSHMAKAGTTVSVGFTVHNFGLNSDTISLVASYQGDGAVPGDPLPSGWAVSYDTGATLNLNSDERVHVMARVTVPAAASEGAYPIRVKATSGNSVSNFYIVFNIDVVNQRLPLRVQVTDSKLPNLNPGIAAYSNYVVVSYLQDTGIGERVFVSVSSDSGATFGAPIPVTTVADDPQCIEMRIAPAGHNNAGRAFIVYQSLKPLVNGDDWAQITNRRIVCARADPPYTTWTVNYPLNNGAGPAAYNDYREMDIGFFSPNQVIIVENNYYNTKNDMNNAWTKFTPYAIFSTDGGATWGGGTDVTMGSSNQFGQTVSRRANGNLVMSNYMIGSPARRMMYREYNGATWTTPIVALTFSGIDAMWGSVGGDPTNNRAYVVAGQSSSANYNDFKLPYVSYTDNGGTSFSAPVGVLGGANNRCDNGHFDSNKMMDMDVTTDGVAWATVKQHPTSTINRFWSYNLYSASSTYTSGYGTHTNNQLTRDSFAKEPSVRATAQGSNLLVAYSAFETGPADIFMLKVYNGWQTDTADTIGPKAEIHAPDVWKQYLPLKISGLFDEFNSGYHNIQTAQYRWDGGTATTMTASDGTYNNVVESGEYTDSVSQPVGKRYLEVRAQDSVGNWGPWVGKYVFIYSATVADEPVFGGLEKVVNTGTGTSLRLEWTAAADPNGNEYPITYHIFRSTTPGFTPNNATNRIDTSQTSAIGDVGNPMTWTNNGLTQGITYYYIVRAVDSGNSMEMNTIEKSGTPGPIVPDQPSNPSPYNGEPEVALGPTLQVTVTQSNGDPIDTVRFYDAATSTQIGTTQGPIADGGTASVVWAAANQEVTTYSWYAVAESTVSPTWSFTTGWFSPPLAPTTLTVHHFGPDSETVVETRFMRGVASEADVNGLTTFLLGTEQSATAQNYYSGSGGDVTTGFRAWVRNSAGVESEITSGVSAIVVKSVAGESIQSAAWNCPETSLDPTDSIVIRVYQSVSVNPPTGLAATFTTQQLGASLLDSAAWTIYYYTRRGANNDRFYWGTTTYNSRIEGMSYTVATGEPTDHNTLNWTHSGAYTDEFRIYRSDSQFGTYTLLDTVPVGTDTYVDLDAGLADTTIWWYRVRAVNMYGEETNTNSVPEPGGGTLTPYEIDLSGKAANSWVYVSFPYQFSGNIQDVLNDATFGDGGTLWTVAKWYNPQTPADPWKTYRVGGTANDLTTITNQMGVWLWITANGGDTKLTTGLTGEYPASAVNINLYAGWNMVGYPTATSRAESATLPAEADLVASWQAASPYITQHAKGATMMVAGNAYWVHVMADCTWVVSP